MELHSKNDDANNDMDAPKRKIHITIKKATNY